MTPRTHRRLQLLQWNKVTFYLHIKKFSCQIKLILFIKQTKIILIIKLVFDKRGHSSHNVRNSDINLKVV